MVRLILIFIVLLSSFLHINNLLSSEKDNVKENVSPVTVNTTVDHSEITIGDKVNLTITIKHDPDTKVTFPAFGEKLADFTIKDYGVSKPKKLRTGKIEEKEWYVLDTFLTGSYVIPSLTVSYETTNGEIKKIETEELFIEVKSVIEGEVPEDIKEIRGPVNIDVNYFLIYVIVGGAFGIIAIVVGIIYFLKLRKRRKIDIAPPPEPAHQIAYRELKELKEKNLISNGKIKEYYYELSNIIRHYIENRFTLMAPERTTEEFLSEMADVQILEREHKRLIKKFLQQCDLVKFAKYGPDSNEIDGAFGAAKKLVDETKQNEILEQG